MSRAQYLKSLEREVHAATKIIDDLTRENYELKLRLQAASTPRASNEVKQSKGKAN